MSDLFKSASILFMRGNFAWEKRMTRNVMNILFLATRPARIPAWTTTHAGLVCCLFSSFSRGFYLWPLRCFPLFSSKTKISKFLFDLIWSRTVEVGRTNYHYYYIVPLNHYLCHYSFSKKKIGSELQNQHAQFPFYEGQIKVQKLRTPW